MSLNERIYRIDQLLSERRSVSVDELLEILQVSRATLKRDLALLRDGMNAPIIFDRELGGYRFDTNRKHIGPTYELPGLWFSANEIYALLTMYQLLSNLDVGGLLGHHIQPLQARLNVLFGTANDSSDEIRKRVKIEMIGVRHFRLEHFEALGSALLKRKRIRMIYHARGSDETSDREVSPQRLIYYRGNWYMDAWCHLKNALRSFSIDMIKQVTILEEIAEEIPDEELDAVLGAGYGIFAGRKVQWATLIFNSEAARWVSMEQWHPKQKGRFLDGGCYELKVPYSDSRELMMDVLRHGSRVKVTAPQDFADSIKQEINRMAESYQP